MGQPPSNPAPPAPAPEPAPGPVPVTPAPTKSPTCEIYAKDGVPQLSVTIADVDDAGTGSDVFARVLTSGRKKTTEWSDWKKLAHTDCNDLDVASTAYFDEFNDITGAWIAVAVYNCGDDDVVIDKIGTWQGEGVDPLDIDYFCPNVGGPSTTCAQDETGGAIGYCYKNSDLEPTDYFKLGQGDCDAFAFETTESSTTGWPIATAYIAKDPGIPDCYGAATKRMMHSEQHQPKILSVDAGVMMTNSMSFDNNNAVMMAIPAAAVLTAAMAYFICVRKTGEKKDVDYAPLPSYGTN